jgi:orotidine-5'-phosphate decarboxylase
MGKDVIIALDFENAEKALAFLGKLGTVRPFVKVGMELYYAEGNSMLRELKKRGHKIFLDLKLHDIPNTVGSAMKVLAKENVDMVNLHAAGGIAMMKEAAEGLVRPDGTRPVLLAVTQLTSTSDEMLHRELLIEEDMDKTIAHYAKNAQKAGLDGVVCSPLEAGLVKEACGQGFVAVTPGIRFVGAAADDQNRITDPAKAKAIGSDYIVVGRPITAAENPKEMYERCVQEFVG